MVRSDFREIKAVCNSENELLHYGVKGMKWRFRKKSRISKTKKRKKLKISNSTLKKPVAKQKGLKLYSDPNQVAIRNAVFNQRIAEEQSRLFQEQNTINSMAARPMGFGGF